MKTIITSLIFTMIFFLGFGQDHDARLLDHYSKAELTEMKNAQPEEYEFLNTALDKAIFIGPIPEEKGKDIVFDGELEINPEVDHTFLSLGIDLKENHYQYFRIKGTNQMVGVLPKSLIK